MRDSTSDANPAAQPSGPPPRAPQEPLWTVRQVAAYLGLHEKTIYDMVAAGRLPVVRMGRLLRFDPRGMLRWVSARKEGC